MDNKRITSNNITSLKDNEIFVFGSNKKGVHGAGAAKTALSFGVKYGQANGLQGNSYAIPTKDATIKYSLSVDEIKYYVDIFIDFAKENNDKTFLVTEIGCGLANHKVSDIAPLFKKAIDVENIHLPLKFWNNLINI